MATANGFIKIYRSLFSNPIWTANEPFDIRSAWIDLIQRAAFVPTYIIKNRKTISLDVGEFAASERDLARDWKLTRTRVREYLGIFERLGGLNRRTAHKTTIFKLLYFAELNDICEPSTTTKQPQQRPQRDHNATTPYIYNKERKKERSSTDSLGVGVGVGAKKENGSPAGEYETKKDGSLTRVDETVAVGASALQTADANGHCRAMIDGCSPSFDAWAAYAISIGWEYSEEYTYSWKQYEQTKNPRGQWIDKAGRVITNWHFAADNLARYYAKKNGRLRNNFRTIAECIDDKFEPNFWRQEYAAQFKMSDISGVDKWFASWADLVEKDYSLACLILARCLKNHAEDRELFRTEYTAEMATSAGRKRIVKSICAKCGQEFEHDIRDKRTTCGYCDIDADEIKQQWAKAGF